MFTIDYRPTKFSEVHGQTVAKSVLQAVLLEPYRAPKTFLLVGEWGTGKTTLARIFGRAINCSAQSEKPCNRCDSCMNLRLYQELDSSVVGNAKAIRDMRETWYYSIEKGWRVIVVDELQVASGTAQSAFLKVLEEPPDSTFFFLLTTNPERILKPIISRSMEIEFGLISEDELNLVCSKILRAEGQEVSERTMKLITRRSGGHARDAVMLLEKALLLGGPDFEASVQLTDRLLVRLFRQLLEGSTTEALETIERITRAPVSYIKVDVERFIHRLFARILGEGKAAFNGKLTEKKLLKLLNYYVRIKPLLGGSSSDVYSALAGLKMILTDERKPVSKTPQPQFSKI